MTHNSALVGYTNEGNYSQVAHSSNRNFLCLPGLSCCVRETHCY